MHVITPNSWQVKFNLLKKTVSHIGHFSIPYYNVRALLQNIMVLTDPECHKIWNKFHTL